MAEIQFLIIDRISNNLPGIRLKIFIDLRSFQKKNALRISIICALILSVFKPTTACSLLGKSVRVIARQLVGSSASSRNRNLNDLIFLGCSSK